MSDEEDCDGLPSILLNSSTDNTGAFSIPSADELASQREREDKNKRKLRELRERHGGEEDYTDSNESESDAALAAAVSGMRVQCVTLPPPRRAPAAAALLAALEPALPAAARALLDSVARARSLPEVVGRACALVTADEVQWADDEVCAVGALLGAAVLARDAPRAPALRALHTLLERRASEGQARALVRVMLGALPAARTRLALSDALRSGGGPVCDALATLTLDVAFVELLTPGAGAGGRAGLARLADAMEAGWARLAPGPRCTALQLLGRRLCAVGRGEAGRGEAGRGEAGRGEAEARARLLAPLAQAQLGHDTQTPEKLKVLVCASKLRLLFGTDK